MRARIIFRGLTLFVGKNSTRGITTDFNVGELTAYLLNDPDRVKHPRHNHKPYMGIIGRKHNDKTSDGFIEVKGPVANETTIELVGYGKPSGVTAMESFLDYVPCMSELHWGDSTGIKDKYVTRKIIIKNGTIRARDFITWEGHGNTPTEIAFMDTNFRGFAANEVVVDIGDDDEDIDDPDPQRFLSLTGGDGKERKLWAHKKGPPADEYIEPNVVEVVIENLPARGVRPLPWGMHGQTLATGAGYPPRTEYENKAQYDAFVAAAMAYDSRAWQRDFDAMGIGQPFPYFVEPAKDRLPKLREESKAALAVNPIPLAPGRRANQGISKDDPDEHHHGSKANDPASVVICPFGRE